MLTVVREGTEMHEHESPGPVLLTVLSGRIRVTFAGPDREEELGPNESSVFARDRRHRVLAIEDATFLVVIGGRRED